MSDYDDDDDDDDDNNNNNNNNNVLYYNCRQTLQRTISNIFHAGQ